MAKITVYTTDHCGFCDAAKKLLETKGLEFKEINIARNDEEKIQLIRKTGHRTLPQIFFDDEFIGGYQELKARLDTN